RHGARRRIRRGEILFDQGTERAEFHVILDGALEVVRPCKGREDLIVVHHAGEFTGETTLLTRRRSLVRGRVVEDGEILELRAEALRALVQTDPELSELIMRAFILRRVSLIARDMGDV